MRPTCVCALTRTLLTFETFIVGHVHAYCKLYTTSENFRNEHIEAREGYSVL